MKMLKMQIARIKKLFLLSVLFLAALSLGAQSDTMRSWEHGGNAHMMISQAAYSNWVAGGQNTVAVNFGTRLFLNYKGDKSNWANEFNLAYGKIKVGSEVRKSDDEIIFNTLYSKRLSEKTGLAVNGNFRTQFDRGFELPGDSILISEFMAPAFTLFSLGIDHKANDFFHVFISPLTMKWTHVGNIEKINPESYGLSPGSKNRYELGAYLRLNFDKDLFENVYLSSSLELFSNYLNRPQNIDVNSLSKLNLKINKYITTVFTFQLIYDYDILISKTDDQGNSTLTRGVQLREIWNIGLSYDF